MLLFVVIWLTVLYTHRHGQITQQLPETDAPLPASWALQHPMDWLNAASHSIAALDIPSQDVEVVAAAFA